MKKNRETGIKATHSNWIYFSDHENEYSLLSQQPGACLRVKMSADERVCVCVCACASACMLVCVRAYNGARFCRGPLPVDNPSSRCGKEAVLAASRVNSRCPHTTARQARCNKWSLSVGDALLV